MPDHDDRALETDDLLGELRKALLSDEPWDLLTLVSSLQRVMDHDTVEGMPVPDIGLLIDSFIGVDVAETTAVLHVFAALVRDEEVRERILRGLAGRHQPMPIWLRDLGATRITRVTEISHVLGDGGNIGLGIRWADGREASYVIYIDTNAGTVVKDAFPSPSSVGQVTADFRKITRGEPGVHIRDVDPAEARARVEAAIERGRQLGDPFETDSWPAGRPLVQWLLRLMPSGATAAPADAAPGAAAGADVGADVGEAFADFALSKEATGISLDPDPESLDGLCLVAISAFVRSDGQGDLLRWSPTRVAILFESWLPTMLADAAVATRLPQVLRAMVAWALRRRRVPRTLIRDTLAAVDACAPDYVETATSAEAMRLRLALQAYEDRVGEGLMGILVLEDPTIPEWETIMAAFAADTAARRVREVGGEEQLASLSADPLPDEPLDWEPIAADARPEVAHILRLVDGFIDDASRDDAFADKGFGVELRTACRRFLTRVATAEPGLFTRGSRVDHAAAAVCWTVGKVNGVVAVPGGMPAVELMRRFALSGSPSVRGQRFAAAMGVPRFDPGAPSLGTADLLISAKRRQLIEMRDRDSARSSSPHPH